MTAPAGLSERDLDPNPFTQFERWLSEALAAGVAAPDAMVLATATPDGVPSARVVLLRGHDERGFTFFTNYESHKGRELVANPRASLVFHWPEIHRQVRAIGAVGRVSGEESDAYFHSRPPGSRLGAWVSHQSDVIAGRDELDRRLAELAAEYEGKDIPRPPFWGGLRLAPDSIEFWQSRPNRLHDRLRYTRSADGGWRIERLAP
jgi:pyridoxamine 5'-phosphate oxidase